MSGVQDQTRALVAFHAGIASGSVLAPVCGAMQLKRSFSFSLIALTSGALALACSSDPKNPGGQDGGGDSAPQGSGGKSGDDGGAGGAAADAAGCSITLAPGADDLDTIQSALDTKVKSGDVVCFSPGTYKITKNHLALSGAANVTFRGVGRTRDEVLFDFTGQSAGNEGVLVTTPHFTIENLSIKNTAGNGIKVQGDYSVFRNIKVSWDKPGNIVDGGPSNGAYAIYPVESNHVLMEDNEVFGAADAGIYAGQCSNVIARRNDAHHNVLGIEIENTLGAEVYENDVHDNTTGFLLDLLPDLQQKDAHSYYVHDNKIHDNNLANFAEKNTLAGTSPQGTGILVLALHDVDISKNKIENNDGVGIMVVSYDIIDLIAMVNGGKASTPDPKTSRWPSRIFVHDNSFKTNGTKPIGPLALIAPMVDGEKKIPYDVLWDGILNPSGYGAGGGDAGADGGGANDAQARICLGTPENTSFANFHADTSLLDPTGWTTASTAQKCTLPAVPSLTP
jgi:parallel beta-helix repeat protein